MRVSILIGNQDISVICNILKILNTLVRTLYLVLSPLILVKILPMKILMNLLQN